MKPQFKPEEIYLDLSKLSEEQINRLRLEDSDFLEFSDIELFRLQNPEYMILSFNHGKFNISHKEWFLLNDKTELTYSQFLDMMGESEEKSKVIENSEKELINNDGTLYIGEGLENYYKDQLERTGKFKVVSIDATSEEVLQVENIKDIAHTEGVLIGLKICKEMWAQLTISHENIQEEIYHYQEELDNLNSNQ